MVWVWVSRMEAMETYARGFGGMTHWTGLGEEKGPGRWLPRILAWTIWWEEILFAEMRKHPEKQAQRLGTRSSVWDTVSLSDYCQGQTGHKAQWCWEERSGLKVDSRPHQVAEAREDGEFWGWAHRALFYHNIQIIPRSAEVLLRIIVL